MRRQDFSYDLPEELIAQSPLAERSESRLLVLDGATGALADRGMADLPEYLRAGDLLVFNDTRVVAARIVGSKPSGGRVEIFLERVVVPVAHAVEGEAGDGSAGHAVEKRRAQSAAPLTEDHRRQGQSPYGRAESASSPDEDDPRQGRSHDSHLGQALVQLRASKPIREGLEITTPGGIVRVLGREDELWLVETPIDALEFFETWGEVPLPPYIHRSADATDRERYQSIFAREKGAVAAPTASLHFDATLVERLEKMGVGRAFVTLHVGAGTFQPLRTDDLGAHKMHAERVSVSAVTWEAIQRTRAAGGRVVAVGTTVVRALETAALEVAQRGLEHARCDVSGGGLASADASVWASASRASAAAAGHNASDATSSAYAPATDHDATDEARPRASAIAADYEVPSATLRPRASATVAGRGAADAAARPHTSATTADRDASNAMIHPDAPARAIPGQAAPARATAAGDAAAGDVAAGGTVANSPLVFSGETRLFIRPGFKFQLVDAMVTNFHLPESTLLMLVSAFAGREHVLAAYAHAVRERYRFFSYGDAMLVMPIQGAL